MDALALFFLCIAGLFVLVGLLQVLCMIFGNSKKPTSSDELLAKSLYDILDRRILEQPNKWYLAHFGACCSSNKTVIQSGDFETRDGAFRALALAADGTVYSIDPFSGNFFELQVMYPVRTKLMILYRSKRKEFETSFISGSWIKEDEKNCSSGS